MDIIDLIFVLIGCLCFTYIGLKVKQASILSPWGITGGVWSAVLTLLIFWGDNLYPIKGVFTISLSIWIITFFIFSISSFYLTKGLYRKDFKVREKLFNIFIFISIITIPFYLYTTYKAINGNYVNIFLTLRENANSHNVDYGLLVYVRALNMALYIIALWLYPNVSKFKFYYLLIINIIIGLSFMEKGTFFFILIATLYVFYQKKRISLKKICIMLGLFVGFAFIFNLLRSNKTIHDADFLKFIAIYISSPTVAFETLKENIYGETGINTFPFFYKISNVLFGTDYEIVSKVKDFVYVPVRTNVYTIMQPFYQDFGFIGIASFAAIYGLICGYIYKRSILGYPIMKCLYVYIANILVLQFFQENLILSLSVLFQYIIIFNIVVARHGK